VEVEVGGGWVSVGGGAVTGGAVVEVGSAALVGVGALVGAALQAVSAKSSAIERRIFVIGNLFG
jgi:hypothetical protein